MNRCVPIAAVLFGAGVAVTGASATESTIYPGVGIGKVKLGMTLAQVEHALGKDHIVDAHDTIGGAQYLELGWDFDAWSVGFLRSGATYHVVQVATQLRSQKTPKGVGPLSFWLQLRKAYPYGICTWSAEGRTTRAEYLVPHKGGTRTIYNLVSYPPNHAPRTARVVSVQVSTRYRPLPEFAPHYPGRCRPETLDFPYPHP